MSTGSEKASLAIAIIYGAIVIALLGGLVISIIVTRSSSAEPAARPAALMIVDTAQDANIAAQFLVVRHGLERRVRDPASLTFRDVRVDSDLMAFCGEYNARNGFGGMAGFEPFVGYVGWAYVEGDRDYNRFYDGYCDQPSRLKPLSDAQLNGR